LWPRPFAPAYRSHVNKIANEFARISILAKGPARVGGEASLQPGTGLPRRPQVHASTTIASAPACALASHDLPIRSRVREAPYLVVLLKVDFDVLRSLYEDIAELATEIEAQALEVHRADARLLDAVGRYLALDESAMEVRVLAPLFLKEIHYRLLVSPLGHMLRKLLRHDSHAGAIARALALLRRDLRAPIVIEDLTRSVGMSESSFHKHFKAVTSSSPLQFQKSLRLLEARRLLRVGTATVTTAAFDVGCESPSQFSREYARKFGCPPSQERAKARRHASLVEPT
jgi:AraC-like DNA-binding protein